MENSLEMEGSRPAAGKRAAQVRRLWTLVLLLVVMLIAGREFVAFAVNPQFQVHSDDLLWMWRFKHLPRPALPTRDVDYARLKYIQWIGTPQDDLAYVNGLDQPALERWVFHYLLAWTGRLPETVDDREWNYDQDMAWNIANGNVAPPDAVRFVRVMNAGFMIVAALLIYVGLARAYVALARVALPPWLMPLFRPTRDMLLSPYVAPAGAPSPVAALAGALYFVFHSALVDVMWSIGSDPLLWLCLTAALALWVALGERKLGVVLVSLAGGLAASAKINGGFVVMGFALWLLLKRRPLRALGAALIGLGVFIVCNPIVFSRGVLGVPAMLWEVVAWRSIRSSMIAAHYPAYADAARWRLVFYLLGPLWPLLPLLLASRRLWRLEPAVFWGATLVVGHLLTVTAPLPRYTILIQAGLVVGIIAAYWPARPAAWKAILRFARKLRAK